MKRRDLLALVGLAGAAPLVLAQPRRLPRIGYLLLVPVVEPPSLERQAFLDAMRDLGHVAGRSVEILYRSAEGDETFLDAMASDLVSSGVDVIVASGSAPILSAMRATRRIPIVMLAVGDPVGIGAVHSIARPGTNVTGVSFISSDLAPKRIQLLKEMLPRARTVAVAWDTQNANAVQEVQATLAAAAAMGMVARTFPISREAELEEVLARIAATRPDVLYVAFEGRLVAGNRSRLAQFALARRIPLVAGWSRVAEAGGLLSYAPDIPTMFRRAAPFVHRVLSGERAETMPVEMPTRIELVINARTAKALGIVLPQALLLRANQVIE